MVKKEKKCCGTCFWFDNEDAYGQGWLFVVELADKAELDALLDADAYAAVLEDDAH